MKSFFVSFFNILLFWNRYWFKKQFVLNRKCFPLLKRSPRVLKNITSISAVDVFLRNEQINKLPTGNRWEIWKKGKRFYGESIPVKKCLVAPNLDFYRFLLLQSNYILHAFADFNQTSVFLSYFYQNFICILPHH